MFGACLLSCEKWYYQTALVTNVLRVAYKGGIRSAIEHKWVNAPSQKDVDGGLRMSKAMSDAREEQASVIRGRRAREAAVREMQVVGGWTSRCL